MPDAEVSLEQPYLEILRDFSDVAKRVRVPWIIVGAFARILLLEKIYGRAQARATMDIDFGVMVDSWQQFEALESGLVDGGRFINDTQARHQLRHSNGIVVDFVPFGGLASPQGDIAWPPDHDVVMSVLGFEEAFEHRLVVIVNNELEVGVVNAECLVILKLLAWDERGRDDARDASDIGYVLSHYHPAVLTDERLFGDYFSDVVACDYDLDLAADRVLARRISHICQAATSDRIALIVQRELQQDISRLADGIAQSLSGGGEDRVRTFLEALSEEIGSEPGGGLSQDEDAAPQ